MSKQVFISHSSKDGKIASELCDFLERNGKECFIAPRDIGAGKEYAGEIINGIDNCKSMILILSENSNDSPHVLREVERAVSKSVPIIIYRLEEVELSKSLEYFLMTNQWLDAKKNTDYEGVLKCVEQALDSADDNVKNDINPEHNDNKSKTGKPKLKVLYIAAALAAFIICIVICIKGVGIKLFNDDKADSKSVNAVFKNIKIGDTVTFGKYQGEDIEWRVLKLSDDKKEAVLVSKYILCMKAYDAAESGKYNTDEEGNSYHARESEADTDMELQANVRGNSDWSNSNIRTWLNSADEVVKYEDQPPTANAMSELKNGYNNEPGFLHDFTKEEIKVIVDTDNKTKANALSDKDIIETQDKVYLLSLDELKWFEDAGIQVLAEPNDKAFELDDADWFTALSESYGVKEYYWWLRDASEEYSSVCYLVGNGYIQENIFERNVGLEGYGIRPAITVSIS